MAAWISLGVVAFVFGALLLLIALLGGGFEIKEARFSQVGQRTRVSAGALGSLFIGLGVWLTVIGQPSPAKPEPPPTTVSGSTPTAMTPTTTQAPYPNEAERDLRAYIPTKLRAQCNRDYNALRNAFASIRCVPSSTANVVFYHRWRTEEDMNAWFFGIVDSKNIARGTGSTNCEKGRIAEGVYTKEKAVAGHVVCYQEGARSWILWTHSRLRIGAAAYRNDTDLSALWTWWTTEPGPLNSPDWTS
jgi:hypothetical protein